MAAEVRSRQEISRGGPVGGRGGGGIFRGGPRRGVAEEGVHFILFAFQGRAGSGRGGGGIRVAFSERAGQGRGGGSYGGRTEGGGGGVLALLMYLDRARPPRLTWVALKPNGLPLGSS